MTHVATYGTLHSYTFELNGTNVVVFRDRQPYHVASYATKYNARRAIRTRAVLRRALRES